MFDIIAHCSAMDRATCEPEDLLLREGQTDAPLFILVSGEVAILKSGAEILRIREPGAVFGEIAALLDIPCTASVVATSPVEVYYSLAPRAFLAANPEIAIHTARILAQRLHIATEYLADIKTQFADHDDHFGMMDRILDRLMQKQSISRTVSPARSDPRL